MNDPRRDFEHAVRVAAREERSAHRALMHGPRPGDFDWQPSEEADYRARLQRWQEASQALVDALDALHAVLHPSDEELPPTRAVRSGGADVEVESRR